MAVALLPLVSVCALSGCASHGAPSFVLFGAYFPAWMLLAAIGILGAALARVALVASGLASLLPLQLGVCTAVGVSSAIFVWLLWFAP